jgi:cell division protein FtsZ
VQKAIQDALHSPLLKNTDIFGSKKLLMVLYVSDDPQYPFEMSEAGQLTDFVNNIDSDVEVMWGLYRIPGLENKVKITILASGFDVTVDDKAIVDPEKVKRDALDKQIIAEQYGDKAADTLNSRPAGTRARILQPNELDSDEAISEAEKTAFTRNRPSVSSSFAARNPNLGGGNTDGATNRQPANNKTSGTDISFDDLLG